MKRTLEGMARAGEPLLLEALAAIRAHRVAEDGGVNWPNDFGHLHRAL